MIYKSKDGASVFTEKQFNSFIQQELASELFSDFCKEYYSEWYLHIMTDAEKKDLEPEFLKWYRQYLLQEKFIVIE